MDTLNRVTTAVFDVLLAPLGALGATGVVAVVGALFVVPALIVFKHISWQQGIKAAKDKIKGHLIAIRIYQDDLAVVAGSVARILGRNAQYLTLNFGPLVPLLAPFTLVASQLVTRYAWEPLPIETRPVEEIRPGQGSLVTVEFGRGHEGEAAGLAIELPAGLEAITPLVRSPGAGRAFQEVVARAAGDYEITLRLASGEVQTKRVFVREAPSGAFQPERVRSFWSSWLFPAEARLPAGSAFARIAFDYPRRSFPFLPSGEVGVLLLFFLASVVSGVVVLKAFRIQI